ncbi:MAG TPA: 2-oxoglutarate dehydrogenase complex dihydrolipoyllysine-residue succinyltransferase [Flavobacteriales bacterium]|nr:dihydrolipoyllysine-residue succinyltransferase [Flavobacteriales bacterium]HRE73394.1 2-oxoglutarate dehydrogenase complex dihydrolipoyllysine-residue succinyltransferase [Flavobacteriales bacterium]HRE95604.1 2-oxoglutarate dehydrogenase complex dihydrolipoyllysine-residue succinyltransferase [Flavobacteriales bacterium]HRJ35765.1 2-oxoglutarate dehydrogenase complex dihydrolipoyllysine-residue succinyltransferase [Flavobacteriales bacterium]HRJ38547.1 2-oxoglutarate dehydrogenase complex 
MAIIEHKVPSPGESITEVVIARWIKSDGEFVDKDDELCEIDSDKATLTVNAEESGQLKIMAAEGDTVKVGQIICSVDSSVKGEAKPKTDAPKAETKKEEKKSEPVPNPMPVAQEKSYATGHPSPAAKKLMDEKGISSSQVQGSGPGGRVTKQDVQNALTLGFSYDKPAFGGTREQERKKMTTLRKKIAERLVSVKNETAMLTTFNEVDMKPIMDLRKKYKDKFEKTHGIGVGFMSFFTKACTVALQQFPAVNAYIDGEEMVFNNYCDVGIAVSTPKGLMVPVLRNAETLSLAGIENGIKEMAIKARDGKLSIDDMTGGTFTITNGGVFGSMLSTPIINPPQSAILGMHNIVERPVAIDGRVEIRPIMYVALSYDHRIIDGKESVSFLVKVKEMLENPSRMLFDGRDPLEVVLGI